jgi:hypothetical protein
MATSSEIKEALKLAAEQVTSYIKDASEMKVETRFLELGENEEKVKPAASSLVKFDGDSICTVPMKRDANNNLVPDTALYELHERNVQTTIEYRVRMMEQFLALLRGA